jgi:hypothetical protein
VHEFCDPSLDFGGHSSVHGRVPNDRNGPAIEDALNALQAAIGLAAILERDHAALRHAIDRAARALATLQPTTRDGAT